MPRALRKSAPIAPSMPMRAPIGNSSACPSLLPAIVRLETNAGSVATAST
jgi:hypothetical protein